LFYIEKSYFDVDRSSKGCYKEMPREG